MQRNWHRQWIAYFTIVRSECIRTLTVWSQTLVPPAITTALYFVIFGRVVGQMIGSIHGIPYIEYITPGLVIMPMLMSAYASATSGIFMTKMMRHIEEYLVSPGSHLTFALGHMTSSVLRAMLIGVIVTVVSSLFVPLHIHSYPVLILTGLLASAIMAFIAIINATFARKWDDINFVPTFILTPLNYLSGIFYSVELLSPFWKHVSKLNPIYYIVSAYRYAFLGLHPELIQHAIIVMCITAVLLLLISWQLLQRYISVSE